MSHPSTDVTDYLVTESPCYFPERSYWAEKWLIRTENSSKGQTRTATQCFDVRSVVLHPELPVGERVQFCAVLESDGGVWSVLELPVLAGQQWPPVEEVEHVTFTASPGAQVDVVASVQGWLVNIYYRTGGAADESSFGVYEHYFAPEAPLADVFTWAQSVPDADSYSVAAHIQRNSPTPRDSRSEFVNLSRWAEYPPWIDDLGQTIYFEIPWSKRRDS